MPRGVRKGFMGHLVLVSNQIVELLKQSPQVEEAWKTTLSFQIQKEWDFFVVSDLLEKNSMNQAEIGGTLPLVIPKKASLLDSMIGFVDNQEELLKKKEEEAKQEEKKIFSEEFESDSDSDEEEEKVDVLVVKKEEGEESEKPKQIVENSVSSL